MRLLWGGRKGKDNDRKWIILKHNASVHKDSITKCSASYWIGEQGNRERVGNTEGWGVNLIKVIYIYTCVKCQGESPLNNPYIL
jgi:hypothetical protein